MRAEEANGKRYDTIAEEDNCGRCKLARRALGAPD